MKNSYRAEREPIIFDSTTFNSDPENGEITIRINSQGAVDCIEEDRTSEISCTDTDNGNVRFINSSNRSAVETPVNLDQFEEIIPDIKQVLQLKKQISILTDREQQLSGLIRFEFRRQLSEIRNLYRLIRSEANEPESQNKITSSHNWRKIIKSLQVAESFCD